MGTPGGRPGTHERLYTTHAVAEWLTVSETTVRRWIHDGKLHGVRLGPRTLRVRESDVEAYIERHADGGKQET